MKMTEWYTIFFAMLPITLLISYLDSMSLDIEYLKAHVKDPEDDLDDLRSLL